MFRSKVQIINSTFVGLERKGQTKVPLSLKKVFKVQALRVIIIASEASWAHNLCKSSQGLDLAAKKQPYKS